MFGEQELGLLSRRAPEISLGKFVSEHFTPLTFDVQTGVVSDEDTNEIWETVKKETIEKVRGNKNGSGRADSPMTGEKEVEKSFWISRPDGWVVNKKMKTIVLLEFKRTSDQSESFYQDM